MGSRAILLQGFLKVSTFGIAYREPQRQRERIFGK
jgi:hypothetical protein